MTNSIPDYSNLKANLSSMTRFFNDQGVNLTESEKVKIKISKNNLQESKEQTF